MVRKSKVEFDSEGYEWLVLSVDWVEANIFDAATFESVTSVIKLCISIFGINFHLNQ